MLKPKTWIFTGYVIPLEYGVDYIRKFAREQMSKLFRILKNRKYGSLTGFSIHMEFKFKPNGTVYLHFHAVLGGLIDFHRVRREWGRVIRYEKAISPNAVAEYISKYASKTPSFLDSDLLQEFYHLLVYKTLMHRFSVTKSAAEENPDIIPLSPSGCYATPALLIEAKSAYMRDSYLNPKCDEMEYHPLLEPPLKFPDFTEPLDEIKPNEIQITTHEKIESDSSYKWDSIDKTRKQTPDFDIITESISSGKRVVNPSSAKKLPYEKFDLELDRSKYDSLECISKTPSKQLHFSTTKLFKKYKMDIVPSIVTDVPRSIDTKDGVKGKCTSKPILTPESDIPHHGNCCSCGRFTYRNVNGKWLCYNCIGGLNV